MTDAPARIDICVCTFRRASLAETLLSIGRITMTGIEARLIVADNDGVPSAQPLVEQIAQQLPFPVLYLHCPAGNISIARNACLDAANADFVAFVDDDETVGENWLVDLLAAAEASGADVVLGPVEALYDPASPDWLRRGNFHSTAPVLVSGEIVTGYTCNVLVRRTPAFNLERFDLALGRSGGEDTDYFRRLHAIGARIAQAPSAVVYEPVPPSRARFGWLLNRRIRSGQSHGMGFRGLGMAARLRVMALAATKAAYCVVMTGITLPSPVLWRRNLLRAALHLGVAGGVLGAPQAQLYGHF
jgi:succinoglycan biosynthesis protein ExoM